MKSEIWHKLRQQLTPLKLVALPSLLILGLILGGRWAGAFQSWELQVLDFFLKYQPTEPQDKRILLVTIDEDSIRSIGRYPIPDQYLAQSLNILQEHEPRAIGLDLFRDIPVDPGSADLATAFQEMENLFGIDKILDENKKELDENQSERVNPPPGLPLDRVGFADAPVDLDGSQRRVMLGTQTKKQVFRYSLALLLAEKFLIAQNIHLDNGINDPVAMRFKSAEIPRIRPNFGGYIRTNTGNADVQMLLNFRNHPKAFETVSFHKLLSGNVSPDSVRNRIVLIGITTPSFQDYSPAAIPSIISPKANWVYGIEIHAHAISQILSATLDQRPLISTWPDWIEYLCILGGGLVGIIVAAYIHSPRYTILAIALSALLVSGISYLALLWGWWLPVVPTLASFLLISLSLDAFYQYDRFIQTKVKAQQQTLRILEQAKTDLEIQVAQRTSELQQSNLELSQAKEAAEMASRAKGKFLAKMSHELRTPLNAILGFSQMMAQDTTLSEANHKRNRLINQSGEHLLGLINDILSLAKLESGKQELRESPFKLSTLLETVEGIFRLRIEQKGLVFRVESAPELPPSLIGDAQKLRQVLINLLSNALKFTPTGHISLRIGSIPTPAGLTLRFEIEDTGEGIAASELHKLFVPFEQTESGEKSKAGTGLGLPISQQFAQLMGGDIKVSSQVGQGTTFTFTAQVTIAESDSDASLQNIADELTPPKRPNDRVESEALPSAIISPEMIAQALGSMSANWLDELHHATLRLKGKQVIQLLSEMPAEYESVSHYLIELAENYEYAHITEVTTKLTQDKP
ncbi:CHASE2 domain-containing protein [Acaryochloris sp. CCMEE 5410]|uniref:CHASE2 domain-containing protein n=1 Tax=Acaryochloris sp. CCMEE 5410 TaxID=310037 RepID=UPI0002484084|nr:CHASE2 domain-containing protein [Acaryochloris sp. CCMEE 5410]KAI9132483.1 CHASE2 domain-containing protein [Acaryochloris sp. CCMEE 5410]